MSEPQAGGVTLAAGLRSSIHPAATPKASAAKALGGLWCLSWVQAVLQPSSPSLSASSVKTPLRQNHEHGDGWAQGAWGSVSPILHKAGKLVSHLWRLILSCAQALRSLAGAPSTLSKAGHCGQAPHCPHVCCVVRSTG